MLAALALAVGCDDPPVEAEVVPEPRAAAYRSPPVEEAMELAAELVQTRGFRPNGEVRRGFLVEQSADTTERPMRTGSCDVILAAGSAAIRELDVTVYASDGSAVAADDIDGPSAALVYCPSQTGTYYLAVRATAGSGLFALRTFRGPTGLEVPIDDLFGPPAPVEPPSRELR